MKAASSSHSHEEYTVRLGDNLLQPHSETALVVPVEDILCHHFFDDKTLRHDIALVFLASSVNYSSSIRPVSLPRRVLQVEAKTECWVTGWGHLEKGGETRSWGAEGAGWCPGLGSQAVPQGTGKLIL